MCLCEDIIKLIAIEKIIVKSFIKYTGVTKYDQLIKFVKSLTIFIFIISYNYF